MKILSALSMAAAATLAAKSAYGVTLSLYYGQDPSYANSNNNVDVATTFTKGSVTPDLQGQYKYLSGTVTPQLINPIGPTTITVPVGGFLSLAIDAVLTGEPNPDAGVTIGESAQPAFLGLSSLSLGISSTDTHATILSPLALNSTALSSFGGATTYNGFAVLNNSANSGTATTIPIGSKSGLAENGGLGVVPEWDAIAAPPDVAPFAQDAASANGNVGLNGYWNGGNKALAGNELSQFAPQTNIATYATATEFGDSLIFKGLTAGTVTLAPYAVNSASGYWSLKTAAHTLPTTGGGVSDVPSAYQVNNLSASDKINNLPVLVINVGTTTTSTTASTSHAIVSLTSTAGANYGTTITSGSGDHQGTFTPAGSSLVVTGGSQIYNLAEVTGINSNNGDATGNVNVSGWNPATDKEIYGVDVKVGGVQATLTQLNTLITEITTATAGNGNNASAVNGVSETDPNVPQVLAALDTATTSYNLFLTFNSGPGTSDNIGLDLSATNDSNLAGYTFSAVSVVPEPMSLGLLALGGVGLMSRRSRRKS